MQNFLVLVLILSFWSVECQNFDSCDYYQFLEPGRVYQVGSLGFRYGRPSPINTNCRYAAEAPYGYKITASCRLAYLLPVPKCENFLKISPSGRTDLADGKTYCGWLGVISAASQSNRMTIQYLTGNRPMGSRFLCSMHLVPDNCECGKRNVGRIVGGNETLVNEFPLMAAIVQSGVGVWCGATIISNKAALTAAHCFDSNTNFTSMQLVVGEHNITGTRETRFTRSYGIRNVTIHESYDGTIISENDIALVFTKTNILYDYGVSPSCLPFRFENYSFSGDNVLGIGWGTTEFAGPKSNVLRKVQLEAVDEFICSGNLLCTTAQDKDLCQYDSGGPILYQNPNNSLLYNIGVISSGDGCGTSLYSTNVRVTAYIDWILEKTMPTVYCVK
ncbi:unnamed protein product [Chironomus riparius]|uniref:Peptidase S1 domain-containing protein n=1 Tax=Chironomus riparius TaxID=315576 RepID=A0A9N9RY78_9DIPT|nr:unnamed protein product [Chironomus riparius]